MAGDEGKRKIRLFCPSLSKMIDWVAWNEQRLDLGSIAGAFGLEPSTVKLNGHFISRGIDLIASSVTWRSLLAFFSAKGLSTGEFDGDALIVDGKLSKVGAKRPQYHPQDTTSSSLSGDGLGLFRNKKLKDQNSDEATASRCNGLGFKRKKLSEDGDSIKKLKLDSVKRKQLREDSDSLKKLKLDTDANTGLYKDGAADKQGGVSSSGLFTPLKCSFINGLKRTRDDELFAAESCKRIR